MFKENVFSFKVGKSGDKSMLFPANTYNLFDLNYKREIMTYHLMQSTELLECDTRPSSEQDMEHGSNVITKEMYCMQYAKQNRHPFSK